MKRKVDDMSLDDFEETVANQSPEQPKKKQKRCQQPPNVGKNIVFKILNNKDDNKTVSYCEFNLPRGPLMKNSSVLNAMLLGSDSQKDEIVINDIDSCTFTLISDYLQNIEKDSKSDILLSETNVFLVLIASDKYMIEVIIKECIDFIRKKWIINKNTLFYWIRHRNLMNL